MKKSNLTKIKKLYKTLPAAGRAARVAGFAPAPGTMRNKAERKQSRIYLDYAAATPIDPAVLKAMQPYFSQHFQNASATYLAGRGVHQALAESRSQVARLLGARPAEIIFTAGATEANNLAIQGLMR